ncbi:MAG: type II toxin-antitoxin system VapC family toxin [Acidobacteriaceae bacterium]|nr:type II toxin-antitoxin system VapC family toxin [Acidobacteriaceae bacterium]MBV9223065.1 type II toxin-antitoxin system VapC family toxin [Acidobacteriaceae bacterium]MBV9308722.1 type II toxin-antitoxin system VapC family toxin [Acidobacteriaceae bacterium]MBV9678999.1 type II toxin-antitoxin system VapC family toxin [Acidobacteriaceae bacterium]
MRPLLDTHALLWWLSDDPALTRAARMVIAETRNTIFVSAASAWEIATKVRLGKLPTAADLTTDFAGYLQREGFQILAISGEHAIRAGLLPGPHKDPFDRLLIAQAQAENMPIVSNESLFDTYGVRRIW